jgi:hypothetical protein
MEEGMLEIVDGPFELFPFLAENDDAASTGEMFARVNLYTFTVAPKLGVWYSIAVKPDGTVAFTPMPNGVIKRVIPIRDAPPAPARRIGER